MPKLSHLEELDIAIKTAAAEADDKTPNSALADDFYLSHPDFAPFYKQWALDRLSSLIGKQRREKAHASDAQFVFEEMLGFKHLPKKMEVKTVKQTTKKVPRADAKLAAFRKLARLKTPAQLEARRIVALMTPHAKKNKNITYGEVLKLEALKKAKKEGLTLPLFAEDREPA